MEVPLESEDQDPSPPPAEAKDNSKHEVVLLKQEILDTIHYTKSKLYFAGCDGKVQAFRADLRIQAMFHDLLPTKYGKSYKDWLVQSHQKRAGVTNDFSEELMLHCHGEKSDKFLERNVVKNRIKDIGSNLELYNRLDKVEQSSDSSFWKTFVKFYEKEQQLDAFPGVIPLFDGLYDQVHELERMDLITTHTRRKRKRAKKHKHKSAKKKDAVKQKTELDTTKDD